MPFYPFGGGQPDNPDRAYEALGWTVDGSGTLVGVGATAFTKGSWVSLGETASAWCGFDIVFGSSATSALKIHVDIGVGEPGSQVAIVSDLYTMTSIAGNTMAEDGVFVPLKVAAGTKLWARASSHTIPTLPTVASQKVSLVGLKARAGLPPGFDTCVLLNGAQATGYAGATNVLMDGTWATLHTTTRAYGAILVTPGTGTSGQTLQEIALCIGLGSSPEIEIFRTKVLTVNANPSVKTGGVRRLIETTIGDSVRISASCLAASTGANPIRAGLHGFY